MTSAVLRSTRLWGEGAWRAGLGLQDGRHPALQLPQQRGAGREAQPRRTPHQDCRQGAHTQFMMNLPRPMARAADR